MSRLRQHPVTLKRVLIVAAILASATICGAMRAQSAFAMSGQESWLEDDLSLFANPTATLTKLRLLGVNRVRVAVRWQLFAPHPLSRRRPRNFNAADPNQYPSGIWTTLDQIVTVAQENGIGLDFDLVGGAPLWATGPGAPRDHKPHLNWSPKPREFELFARAVATRYSGNYDPMARRLDPGSSRALPKVNFWSVWNEPDYGPSLAPQGVPGHLKFENSPRMYRNLVAAEWNALQATGHRGDSFVIGELAPRGANFWGVFSGMKPLVFLRAMYCVDSRYRKLRGSAARIRGCPATARASRSFRARNPGLFKATGVADHPYMRWYPPNKEQFPDPDYSSLGEIGRLTGALDRLQRVYGSRTRYPIYNSEFGYITTPPKHDTKELPWLPQPKAAMYLNWAEYISWRNPRIRSYSQYLLYDPVPARKKTDFGGFASGLLSYGSHAPKATYNAWRLPVYLPVTSASPGRILEVWGCARPAYYAAGDTRTTPTVEIQFQQGSTGPFKTLRTVAVTDSHGYFDVPMSFPASGTVRLAYTYPSWDRLLGYFDPLMPQTVVSRPVAVTVR